MTTHRGFALLTVLVMASGLIATSGSGFIGIRLYQSYRLTQEGDALFNQGQYEEAAQLYERALTKWSADSIDARWRASLKRVETVAQYKDGLLALSKSDWAGCIDKLQGINGAQSALEQCESSLAAEQQAAAEAEALAAAQAAQAAQAATATRTTTSKPSTSTTTASPTQSTSTTTTTSNSSNTSSSSSSQTATCQNNSSPTFTNHITDTSLVTNFVVPPRTVSGHLKTHSYINSEGQRVPLYAPTAATLYAGAYIQHSYGDLDYGLDFRVSCEVTFRFGHVTDPVQSIKDAFGPTPQTNSITKEVTPITFAAGELVGYTTGTTAAGNWDFGVYNSATQNRYASDPNWNSSAIYTTAVCPYDYFSAGLKSAYTAKYLWEFGVTITDGEPFCAGAL